MRLCEYIPMRIHLSEALDYSVPITHSTNDRSSNEVTSTLYWSFFLRLGFNAQEREDCFVEVMAMIKLAFMSLLNISGTTFRHHGWDHILFLCGAGVGLSWGRNQPQ